MNKNSVWLWSGECISGHVIVLAVNRFEIHGIKQKNIVYKMESGASFEDVLSAQHVTLYQSVLSINVVDCGIENTSTWV